jgi:hypothetical protein
MVLGLHKGDVRSEALRRQPSTPGIRPVPCQMTDSELLRFGMVAKYRCAQEASAGDEKQEAFASQLNEARKEWNRRFPRLPLSATFEIEEAERSGAGTAQSAQSNSMPDKRANGADC